KFTVTPPEWVKDHPGYFSLLDLGDTEREILFPQETLFGCNFCIRKNVLMEVGGFNPDGFSNLEYYWQRGDGETGLQRKIAQTPWRMLYNPSAWLFHQIPQTRLTHDFLIRRAQTQAVSDSFTYYRTHPGLFPLAKGLGLSILMNFKYLFNRITRSENDDLQSAVRKRYWAYRQSYAWKVLTTPALLFYTRLDTYWDKP
ncbi:MAG TPA: hypothetical protein VN376_07360, partial [Longilinea sp.]|nr:hypothetical protein [Longilinea sp.]